MMHSIRERVNGNSKWKVSEIHKQLVFIYLDQKASF